MLKIIANDDHIKMEEDKKKQKKNMNTFIC